MNVHGQAVGILAHHGQRLRAVLTIDAHRKPGRDAVGLKKNHELANALMLRPGGLHGFQALFAETGQFEHALGVVIHDVERACAEVRHDAVSPLRPYALDAAGREKKPYALFGGGQLFLKRGHLYLTAELRMLDPAALHAQPGAGLRRRHAAHHGHRIFPSLHAEPEYRPAVFRVVEDHALQRAGKFLRAVGAILGQHIHLFHIFPPRALL